jgi:hypothetical protein
LFLELFLPILVFFCHLIAQLSCNTIFFVKRNIEIIKPKMIIFIAITFIEIIFMLVLLFPIENLRNFLLFAVLLMITKTSVILVYIKWLVKMKISIKLRHAEGYSAQLRH